MASIPFESREDAAYNFIKGGFRIEESLESMRRRFKDEPTVARSKNPDVLLRNIVMMGGSGDQKQLNMVAFRNALDRYIAEESNKVSDAARQEQRKLAAENAELQAKLSQAYIDLREDGNRRERLQERVNDLQLQTERYQLQLQAGVTQAETSG